MQLSALVNYLCMIQGFKPEWYSTLATHLLEEIESWMLATQIPVALSFHVGSHITLTMRRIRDNLWHDADSHKVVPRLMAALAELAPHLKISEISWSRGNYQVERANLLS